MIFQDATDLIPDPDSETVDGEPVDIVEALRAKREAAERLLPLVKPLLERSMATADGDEYKQMKAIEEGLREVAEHFDMDYDSL